MAGLTFDILARDRASDAFKKVARSVDDVNSSMSRVAKISERTGNQTGLGFARGLKKWITGSGADLGKQGGTVFGSGFLGALKTPILGPAIAATVATAVATVMPAVGAIAGTGLVAGFGAGIGALGIVFAAKSEAVKKVWSKTLKDMAADMQVLSRPFESTLISMANVAKRTFARFKPELDSAFKLLAPTFTEFGDQVGRAFERLAPVIRPVSLAFAEVVKTLGPATQDAVGKVSQGLQGLAESVQRSPNALADVTRGIGDLSKNLLDGIATLNNINGAFERFTGGVSLVDGVMKGLGFAIDAVLGPFRTLEAVMEKVGLKTREFGASAEISAKTAQLWIKGLSEAEIAALGVGTSAEVAAPKVESLTTRFERQKSATDSLITSLFRLQNLALGLSGAQISFQAAIDAATASVKENGRTLDINTAKGRANKTALNNIAQAANQQTQAMIESGKGIGAAAKSAEGSRANFVRLARQMGLTKPQAEAMARQMIAIPNVSRTAKLTANKKDLEAKLAAAQRELANKNLTKERRAKLTADISNAKSGIATINGMLGRLPKSKTTVLTTINRIITERRNAITSRSPVARAEGRAVGGPVRKGMPYIVGERGPEWMIPDQNGTIIPNGGSTGRRDAAAMAGGMTTINVNVNGARDPRATADEIVRSLRRYIRIQGGDVQAVLGR